MMEKDVLFVTLLEGEIIKGLLSGFSRYEISMNMKGKSPVTILRHSIFNMKSKKGRSFLKSHQETQRDWEKSALFVTNDSQA
jgi:hypothetical protein